jgi:hypothetical protein
MDEAAPLLFSWRDHAREAQAYDNPFEAFIFNWIAFNGWAERATDREQDAQWIRALAKSHGMRKIFADALGDTRFSRTASDFADLWPILKASEQRALAIPWSGDRREAVDRALMAGVAHQPQCFLLHSRKPPLDWPHTLHALYRVRNNLFHGEKGMWIDADRRVVTVASDLLAAYLDTSMLLGY